MEGGLVEVMDTVVSLAWRCIKTYNTKRGKGMSDLEAWVWVATGSVKVEILLFSEVADKKNPFGKL